MPRFDGSYPSFGLEYDPDSEIGIAALPQVEADFTTVAWANGNLDDGIKVTNGTRPLDPSFFTDIGLTETTIYQNGLVGGASGTAGFKFPNVVVRGSGSGFEVGLSPAPNAGSWTVDLRMLDGTDSGYIGRLSSTGVLSILLVVSGTETVLRTTTVNASSSSTFSFLWDGGSRYKASYNGVSTTEVDDTQSPLGHTMSITTNAVNISSVVAGVSLGVKGMSPTARDRNISYSDILFYDGVDFPWPVTVSPVVAGTDTTVLPAAILDSTNLNLLPIVTLAYAPPEYMVGSSPAGAPDPADVGTLVDGWVQAIDENENLSHFIIWRDNHGLRCQSDSGSSAYDATPGCTGSDEWDFPRYLNLYQTAETALRESRVGCRVYGPNIKLQASGTGFDALYGGVTVDSRDMDFLELFLDEVNAATPTITCDGIALSGEFTDSEWEDLIPYLKTICSPYPLIITAPDQEATPSQANADSYLQVMDDNLDSGDLVLRGMSGLFFTSPRLSFTEYDWSFSATLSLPHTMEDARLKVVSISDKVLLNGAVSITSDHATPYTLADELPTGSGFLSLGDLEEGTYSISVYGDKGEVGTGLLRLGIFSDNFETLTVADTKFLGA